MSPPLPLKDKAQSAIVQLSCELKPCLPSITAEWRARMFEEFRLDGRAMAALERVNLGTGFTLFCRQDFTTFHENLCYYGTRLAKLNVTTAVVARSMELYQQICEPAIQRVFPEQQVQMLAALEMFTSANFVTVSTAYSETQRKESSALLRILDAELTAANVSSLLQQVLRITTEIFGAQVGVILLLDEAKELHAQAWVGFDQELDRECGIPIGVGFTGSIAASGEPGIMPDLAQGQGVLNPLLREKAKALWGVPLKNGEAVIGVLTIGFQRPYDWLPVERDLLRAIADRSALAIHRARMTEALRERETRIAELSGHLLRAQEEERKRISRELHDETGQALMVIRLYLGMLESTASRGNKTKIRETLAVVDRTIEGIRRIIGRLSPLVLQELGLIAAIRKEAKDLATNTGVKAKVVVAQDVGRLPAETEIAIYRVVQEALHNVAKHAQAKSVTVQMSRDLAGIRVQIEDDGIGIGKTTFSGRSFGLAGMKERVGMLGGSIQVNSTRGRGTRIEVTVPASGGDPPQGPRSSRALPTLMSRTMLAGSEADQRSGSSRH